MRHLRFGSSEKKCVARVVDGVVDLLLRGKRYLRDLKFFTLGSIPRLKPEFWAKCLNLPPGPARSVSTGP